ncbi:hypothetical protein [Nocardia amamiensis]|uniref:hypothetical protein n=1 Tax=Nocardia amamiensis TaxID=404578 RepID=UPI0033E8F3CE
MTETPVDPPLWEIVRVATRDILDKIADAHPDREALAQLVANGGADALNDIFDYSTKNGEPLFRYVDVAEIASLAEAIKARPPLREKLSLPDFSAEDPYEHTQVHLHEAAQIPIVLASNCIHEFGFDVTDDNMRGTYSGYETYLLGESYRLPADVVVPILGVELAIAKSPDHKCSVVQMDEQLRDLFALRDSSHIASYDISALDSASHALIVSDTYVRVEGFGGYFFAHLNDESEDEVARFFEALSIKAPGGSNWAEFAVKPQGWSANFTGQRSRESVQVVRDYVGRIDSLRSHGEMAVYELDGYETERVLHFYGRLANCHKSIRVATQRLARSRARLDHDDRVIDLCIGLEAILGNGFSETLHRLSMRTAALLAQIWKMSSAEAYKATSELYKHRSRIVHGDPKPYDEGMITLGGAPMHVTRFGIAALSSILEKIIDDKGFNPKHLDKSLIFAALDSVAQNSSKSDDSHAEEDA